MSGQPPPPQRVRRNVSPGSTKQGPMRATLPVSVMRQVPSPTRSSTSRRDTSPSNSPTLVWQQQGEANKIKNRQSPDCPRKSPERRSPGKNPDRVVSLWPLPMGMTGLSAAWSSDEGSFSKEKPHASKLLTSVDWTLFECSKGEKSKTLNVKSVSAAPYIRRTASLDAIYLAGQWPRDVFCYSYCGRPMMDRATQTPDDWEEIDRKKGSQKKASVTGGEQLEMKYFRHRLQQRTNQGSRWTGGPPPHQWHSPVHGDHSAISATGPANGAASPTSPSTPPGTSPFQVPHSQQALSVPCTGPIPIPHIPKTLVPRMRSSVEGLNQEIERLVLRGISGLEGEGQLDRVLEPTPEGHRAPIADLFRATRSVNTQTPSEGGECSAPASRSHSISPVVPIIPGQMDSSPLPSPEGNKSASPDAESNAKLGTSPHINKFLAREPPDGCERVKIVEEPKKPSTLGESLGYCSLKPSVNFVLMPSQSSAFCPLYKNYLPPSPLEGAGKSVTSPTHHSGNERLQ